jgi:hypothetical protein
MKQAIRWLCWPGLLIAVVLAIAAVNVALIVLATGSSAPMQDSGGAQ